MKIFKQHTYGLYLCSRAFFRLVITDTLFGIWYLSGTCLFIAAYMLIYWGGYLCALSLATGWLMALVNIEMEKYRPQVFAIMAEIEKEEKNG
jgi:hypothetical protein